MRDATWKYGHGNQIMLDGTFGVCDSKVLLFIVMGVDENWKGVSLVFFLFSAPSGNRATHAGYDTKIFSTLITSWRDSLGRNEVGETFEPKVAITDTDIKERGALVSVWAGMILLHCKFHLKQGWTSHRGKVFGVKSEKEGTSKKSQSEAVYRAEIFQRLDQLQEMFVNISLLFPI